MSIRVDLCMFMSNNVICVVYVYDCLFWEHSQYDINNVINVFNEDGPSKIGNTKRDIQCLNS